jgi:membrane protease YdiL (CAAX protease family)
VRPSDNGFKPQSGNDGSEPSAPGDRPPSLHDQPSAFSHQPSGEPPAPSLAERIVALLEVLLCSGYPTQIALGGTFAAFGYAPRAGGDLTLTFVVGVSLLDAVFVVGLVFLFLYAHGERPREVIVGDRSLAREVVAGIPLIFVAFAIAVTVVLTARRHAPFLHTVEKNPLEALLRTPRDSWIFALVVVVAGGVREEIQRAFILRRFERWLGGATTGLLVTSLAFGAGHLMQGADAAIATGLLGAMWAFVYLRRRSAIAPMVSHGGFNLLQIVPFLFG